MKLRTAFSAVAAIVVVLLVIWYRQHNTTGRLHQTNPDANDPTPRLFKGSAQEQRSISLRELGDLLGTTSEALLHTHRTASVDDILPARAWKAHIGKNVTSKAVPSDVNISRLQPVKKHDRPHRRRRGHLKLPSDSVHRTSQEATQSPAYGPRHGSNAGPDHSAKPSPGLNLNSSPTLGHIFDPDPTPDPNSVLRPSTSPDATPYLPPDPIPKATPNPSPYPKPGISLDPRPNPKPDLNTHPSPNPEPDPSGDQTHDPRLNQPLNRSLPQAPHESESGKETPDQLSSASPTAHSDRPPGSGALPPLVPPPLAQIHNVSHTTRPSEAPQTARPPFTQTFVCLAGAQSLYSLTEQLLALSQALTQTLSTNRTLILPLLQSPPGTFTPFEALYDLQLLPSGTVPRHPQCPGPNPTPTKASAWDCGADDVCYVDALALLQTQLRRTEAVPCLWYHLRPHPAIRRAANQFIDQHLPGPFLALDGALLQDCTARPRVGPFAGAAWQRLCSSRASSPWLRRLLTATRTTRILVTSLNATSGPQASELVTYPGPQTAAHNVAHLWAQTQAREFISAGAKDGGYRNNGCLMRIALGKSCGDLFPAVLSPLAAASGRGCAAAAAPAPAPPRGHPERFLAITRSAVGKWMQHNNQLHSVQKALAVAWHLERVLVLPDLWALSWEGQTLKEHVKRSAAQTRCIFLPPKWSGGGLSGASSLFWGERHSEFSH